MANGQFTNVRRLAIIVPNRIAPRQFLEDMHLSEGVVDVLHYRGGYLQPRSCRLTRFFGVR